MGGKQCDEVQRLCVGYDGVAVERRQDHPGNPRRSSGVARVTVWMKVITPIHDYLQESSHFILLHRRMDTHVFWNHQCERPCEAIYSDRVILSSSPVRRTPC